MDKNNSLKYIFTPLSVTTSVFKDKDIHVFMYCSCLAYDPLYEGYITTDKKKNFNFVFEPNKFKSFISTFIQSGFIFENIYKAKINIKKHLKSLYDTTSSSIYINPESYFEPSNVNNIGIILRPSLITFDCTLENELRYMILCNEENNKNTDNFCVNMLIDDLAVKSIISILIRAGTTYEKYNHKDIGINDLLQEYIKPDKKDTDETSLKDISFYEIDKMFEKVKKENSGSNITSKKYLSILNLLAEKIKISDMFYSIVNIDETAPFIITDGAEHLTLLFIKEEDALMYIQKHNISKDYKIVAISKSDLPMHLYKCGLFDMAYVKFICNGFSYDINSTSIINTNKLYNSVSYKIPVEDQPALFKRQMALLKQSVNNPHTIEILNENETPIHEQEYLLCQLLRNTSFLIPVQSNCYPLILNQTLKQALSTDIEFITNNTELQIFTDWYEFEQAYPNNKAFPVVINFYDIFSIMKYKKLETLVFNKYGNSVSLSQNVIDEVYVCLKKLAASSVELVLRKNEIEHSPQDIQTFIEENEDYNDEEIKKIMALLYENKEMLNELEYFINKREFVSCHMATNYYGYTAEKLFTIAGLSELSSFIYMCEIKKDPQNAMNNICKEISTSEFPIYTKEFTISPEAESVNKLFDISKNKFKNVLNKLKPFINSFAKKESEIVEKFIIFDV